MPVVRDFPTDGRWWDTGAPAVPRPKWGTLRVEHEEARSRQRALSLADLIRSGQPGNEATIPPAAAAAAAVAAAAGRGQGGLGSGMGEKLPLPSWRKKRWGDKGSDPASKEASRGGENNATSHGAAESTEIPVGFGKRVTSRRAVSMMDPRDAEKAALLNELERRHARRQAVAPNYDKLSLVEKHLHREREFQEQREKRRAAAERQALKKVRAETAACRMSSLVLIDSSKTVVFGLH